jgi:hypothetical protein
MRCPSCSNKLSIWDIGKEFACPKCGAKLRTSGQTRIFIFEVLAFLLFGWLAAYFLIEKSYVLSVVVLAIWICTEIFVRRRMTKIEIDRTGNLQGQ